VARAQASGFVRWVAGACRVLAAATGLLEYVAGLLRQLVHVVGWLVLLWGAGGLLAHPSLSVGHLAVSGAGALAVVQGLVRSGRRQPDVPTVLPSEAPRSESAGNAGGVVADGAAGSAQGRPPCPDGCRVPLGRVRRRLKSRTWLRSLRGALGLGMYLEAPPTGPASCRLRHRQRLVVSLA
jgi:hypothetical protein